MIINIEIANRLLQYRKEKGYSQEELAEQLGLSRQAISKWERAEASPDTDNLLALSQLYGVTLDELLTGKKAEDTPKGDNVSIGFHGIHVDDKEGNHVHIGSKGVYVDANGHRVEKVEGGYNVDGEFKTKKDFMKSRHALYDFPVAIIVVMVYVGIGLIYNVWSPTWTLFLLIPFWHGLSHAIVEKRYSYIIGALLLLGLSIYIILMHLSSRLLILAIVATMAYMAIADWYRKHYDHKDVEKDKENDIMKEK